MKRLITPALILWAISMLAWAGSSTFNIAGDNGQPLAMSNGGVPVDMKGLLYGEDKTNSVFKVEGQFSYQTPVTSDTAVKASAGYVHYLACSPTDNAAVAGTIQLRDSLSAGAGNIVFEWTVLAIDYTVAGPRYFPIDSVFGTGIYLDFTTTSDVKCWVSYR